MKYVLLSFYLTLLFPMLTLAAFPSSNGIWNLTENKELTNVVSGSAGALVINGNGYTLTNAYTTSNNNNMRFFSMGYSLDDWIIRDLHMLATRPFWNGISGTYGGQFIAVRKGDLTLEGCTLEGGIASSGGAIYVYENDPLTVTITNTTFKSNNAQQGGAIYISNSKATVIIANSTFTGNSANVDWIRTVQNLSPPYPDYREYGGAILFSDAKSTITLENVLFENNTANDAGGAIFASNNTLLYKGCTFRNNKANNGGAVEERSTSDTKYERCLFIQNEAVEQGGAIRFSYNRYYEVENSEFIGNKVTSTTDPDNTFGGSAIFIGGYADSVSDIVVSIRAVSFKDNIDYTKHPATIFTYSADTKIPKFSLVNVYFKGNEPRYYGVDSSNTSVVSIVQPSQCSDASCALCNVDPCTEMYIGLTNKLKNDPFFGTCTSAPQGVYCQCTSGKTYAKDVYGATTCCGDPSCVNIPIGDGKNILHSSLEVVPRDPPNLNEYKPTVTETLDEKLPLSQRADDGIIIASGVAIGIIILMFMRVITL